MTDGKIALVTGANKGIGFEISRQLAALGLRVILTARNDSRGEAAANKLKTRGFDVFFQVLDVTDAARMTQLCEIIGKRFGRLDVLINNAGISLKEDRGLPDFADAAWSSIIAANVEGPLRLAREFYKMIPPGGRIINISSGGGSMSEPVGGWSPLYCISKSTLNAVTRHLDHFLSEKGISVSAVCPGWVRTDMGGRSAPRTVEQGADTAVWLATTKDFPSGKFWRDRKVIPW